MYKHIRNIILKTVALLGLLYFFLLSIELIGSAFKLFGSGLAEKLLQSTSSPIEGLFIGILVTSMVQSSSTVTSIVVGMVGGGALTIAGAIPIVMGANIGTSVTNTIVSIGSVGRREEFKRAFGAATVHDYFNILAVIIIFPLQISFNVLGRSATFLSGLLLGTQGLEFKSPLKIIVKPVAHFVIDLAQSQPVIVLIIGFVVLFVSLKYIVTLLKSVILNKAESFFDKTIFKTAVRAFVFGMFLTVLVQSSSVTTSLVVPLVGAGMLNIVQIYPYTIGANVGTTMTTILASLVTGEIAAVTVAFAHLLFNIFGGTIIFGIKYLRNIPLYLAEKVSNIVYYHRWISIIFISTIFFIIPILVIFIIERF
ncbi:MAG: Na/Pi symporter [Candidatus Marinimicrobia bacterium]|nr:Na/Pi symporter [Candidatus Neomarinimicrobiota bacterium]